VPQRSGWRAIREMDKVRLALLISMIVIGLARINLPEHVQVVVVNKLGEPYSSLE
jgi:hypothetical protein